MSNSSCAYDLLDVEGRGSPEGGRSQLKQITKPESGRQGRGTRSKSRNQSDKGHEQPRALDKSETVVREQKMRAYCHPEGMQVKEDSAPGGIPRYSSIPNRGRGTRARRGGRWPDHGGGRHGQEHRLAPGSCEGPEQYCGRAGPDGRCEYWRYTLIADPDADEIPAPEEAEEHEQQACGQRHELMVALRFTTDSYSVAHSVLVLRLR
jgi:hypothetical protein